MYLKNLSAALLFAAVAGSSVAQSLAPSVRILLPEKTRLLQGQLVDLVVEVRNATSVSGFSAYATSLDLTPKFSAAAKAELDCNASSDWVYRANLQSFNSGTVQLTVRLTADGQSISDTRLIQVRPFDQPQRRNLILFIGDAMGTAYRDAGRLVGRAIVDATGKSSFREGLFDSLQEMDKLPVAGMVMTSGTDAIVPDSGNTGTAWASGNKTFTASLNAMEDGTDCKWRFNGQQNATTLPFILDNPRVENLWQYLKRLYGYRTGIVSTAAITDATPAVEGAYTAYRQTRLEIARQYRENPMLGGAPAFDVILGGGADPFTRAGRPDKRDLVGEFVGLGFRYVKTATELKAVTGGQPLIGLFKGSTSPAPSSNGIATGDVNMDVAYDKLGLTRPASEPAAALGAFTDQPMLELMTQKAIEVLSATGQNYILMVEAASIDKQSHPNNAAGTIWDTIEMDKSVGVARAWAAARETKDTLIVVTADHDQSMSIIGVSNTPDAEYFDRNKSLNMSLTTPVGAQGFTVYGDSFSNARAGLPFVNLSTTASNNTGPSGMPGTFTPKTTAADPASDTFSTYSGLPYYKMGSNGYPVNSGTGIRRLAVGFRTGDHTGSSVPVTAEGPGALLFTGYMDQTDIFFKMAASASMDTTVIDKALEVLTKTGGFPATPGK
ncbi:MAG: alkaline phosphatase [Acidobacteriota bacterium]